jgi:mRNA interferase MazF
VICERGEIVVAAFKFTEMDVFKRRPILVLSHHELFGVTGQIIAAMITTAAHSSWPFDVDIDNWSEAGLSQRCTVRMKISTIDASIIEKRIGRINNGIMAQVTEHLADLLT